MEIVQLIPMIKRYCNVMPAKAAGRVGDVENDRLSGRGALLFMVLLSILFVVPLYASQSNAGKAGEDGTPKAAIVKGGPSATGSEGKKIALIVNIKTAYDEESRKKGLSGLQSMPAENGMLFVLDAHRHNYFWMKGMKFPLDILFFDVDKRLTGFLPGLAPCEECRIYEAPEGTAYALEINAGMAGKYGLEAGDVLVLSDSMNKEISAYREGR